MAREGAQLGKRRGEPELRGHGSVASSVPAERPSNPGGKSNLDRASGEEVAWSAALGPTLRRTLGGALRMETNLLGTRGRT